MIGTYFKTVGTFLITALPMVLKFLNAPAGRQAEYAQNSSWPNMLPDVYTLAELYNRGTIDSGTFTEAGKKLGYGSEWLLPMYLANQQYLTAYEYIAAWRRGIISENALEERLESLKIQKFDRSILERVTEFFPSPADLVTFAVREVYSPEIVAKFGQMEDLPEDFVREAGKAGMSLEQAKNYWAAHWDLPSTLQGFEMLHRRVINQDELNMLLRAKDVMPFWREKLTQISYNTLTRVDVRRMYSVGVLDRQAVYENYLDIGYNEKNAELMTEFTVRYENEAMDGLTRATVVGAYKDSLINKEELTKYLQGFGYSDEVVEFWTNQADYERTLEQVKIYKQSLITLYKKGSINEIDIRNFLLQEDLPATYIDQVIAEAITSRAERTKVPSREDLEKWLRTGYIDEDYFVSRMRLLGYNDEDIQLYLTIIAEETNTKTRKYLDLETYSGWYLKDIMSREQFLKTLLSMGYTEVDREKILGELEAQKNEITEQSQQTS
jgi:hypothetical protein